MTARPADAPEGVRYRIHHETVYEYSLPVTLSRHVAHLEPRATPWQTVRSHLLQIAPQAAALAHGLDGFGNPIARIAINAAHQRLVVAAETQVSVRPRPWVAADPASHWDWQRTVVGLRYRGSLPLGPTRFRFESPHIRVKQELGEFIAPLVSEGADVATVCLALTRYIFGEFDYAPASTGIGTSVLEVLHTRRGVCQDFAHLMIAVLRSNGLAARYVSGYLLTEVAPGAKRLVGVDASHAWVAVYCPRSESEGDWIEFDPTNGCLADERYVTLGWGRDFSDVSPLRGVILGGGEHRLAVAVTVSPEGEGGDVPVDGEAGDSDAP
jgi:transglutaminase-like putative cysteine protease